MAAMDALKRAPKWAWFTVGGVGLGALAIRVWNDRDSETTEDGTGVSTVGQPSAGVMPSSPTPVITPPVIIGGDSGDNGALTTALAMFGSGFDSLTGAVVGLASGAQSNTDTALGIVGNTNNTIGDIAMSIIAGGGGAPAPVQQNPTPVYVNITAPPAPSPATPAPPKKDPCTGEYPFLQDQGTRKGQCYKVVLRDGGQRWNYYKSGEKVRVP